MKNLTLDAGMVFTQTIRDSIEAVQSLIRLNDITSAPIEAVVANAENPVVVCALGKSGYIAAKLAATLKSLDIRAEYLHASEAMHGDLGSIRAKSLVIFISNSGETEEVVTVAQQARDRGAVCLGITAYLKSRLGLTCEGCFLLPERETVCRIGIAPMSSTTVSLIICDAIANVLSLTLKRDVESFRKNHPGGKLGKTLSPIGLLMKPVSNALVGSDVLISDALKKMTGVGFVLVKDGSASSALGIFTDGDLRRLLERGIEIKGLFIGDYCTYDPVTVSVDKVAYEVDILMAESGVSSVLVADKSEKIVGTYSK